MAHPPQDNRTREELLQDIGCLSATLELRDNYIKRLEVENERLKEVERLKNAIHIIKRQCFSCDSMEADEDCHRCDVNEMKEYLDKDDKIMAETRKNYTTLNILIEKDEAEILRRYAAERGWTLSGMFHAAIDRFVTLDLNSKKKTVAGGE